MTMHNRLFLFVLSALCLVIIPALMVSTYHVIEDVTKQSQPVLAILGLIPLALVLIVCFAGLFVSIFRAKTLPRETA